MDLLKKLGDFGFDKLYQWVRRMDEYVSTDGGLGFITNITDSLAAVMPFIMMAIMAFFVFFGKKLLPYIKFVFALFVGIGLGIYFLHPVLSELIGMPAIISGLVVGILAAVFYRLVYVLFFAVAVFYSVFTVCNSGFGDAFSALGDVSLIIYAVVAIIAVVLAFILRKYVEMLGTAMLGARVIAVGVVNILGNPVLGTEWLLPLLITLVIGVLGFVVQVKTRKRY